MLAYFIPIADPQIATLSSKPLVQRIGAQHRAGRDFIAFTQSGPSFDVDIRLEHAALADDNVRIDHAKLADYASRAGMRIRMHARTRRYLSGGVDGHSFV